MHINPSKMSTAELNKLKVELESETSTANQAELNMVLEELQLRKNQGDVVTISSVNNANKSDTSEIENSIITELKGSITDDFSVFEKYNNEYNQLLNSQMQLEAECKSYDYSAIEKVERYKEVRPIRDSIKVQIEKIENLIAITQKTIKSLEAQKEEISSQLQSKESEKNQFASEMGEIQKQINQNEKTAEQEADSYEKGAEAYIKRFIDEFNANNLQEDGLNMQEYVQQKMEASYKLPESIQSLYNQNDVLIDNLNFKAQQHDVISSAVESLTTRLNNIDNNINTQNTKLSDYKNNLAAAKEYQTGVETTFKKLKKAQKKRGLGGVLKKLFKGAKGVVKDIFKGVKKTVQGITGAISDTIKFAGKAVGDILKPLGLEGFCEGIGNVVASKYDFIGGALTLDKNEMKESLKDLEEGAETAVESKIFRQVEKYGKKAVKEGWNAFTYINQKYADILGDVVSGAFNAVGTVVDKAGLDSLGNGIKAVGEFHEGIIDLKAGAKTLDKDLAKDGFDQAKDNVVEAGQTCLRVLGAILSAGATELTADVLYEASIDLVIDETISEISQSLGDKIGGSLGNFVSNASQIVIQDSYNGLSADNFELTETTKKLIREAVTGAAFKAAKETGLMEKTSTIVKNIAEFGYDYLAEGTSLEIKDELSTAFQNASEEVALTETIEEIKSKAQQAGIEALTVKASENNLFMNNEILDSENLLKDVDDTINSNIFDLEKIPIEETIPNK